MPSVILVFNAECQGGCTILLKLISIKKRLHQDVLAAGLSLCRNLLMHLLRYVSLVVRKWDYAGVYLLVHTCMYV